MKSASLAAQAASNVAPKELEALSSTLNLISRKLGESGFASVQVRAVEDLLKRLPTSGISSDAFKAFASQMELASSPAVRNILENADFSAIFDSKGPSAATASGAAADGSPITPGNADSAYLWQGWNDLSEVEKLRIVAVVTFIVLHLALAAAQANTTDHEYLADLIRAAEGTVAVVRLSKVLELFTEE